MDLSTEHTKILQFNETKTMFHYGKLIESTEPTTGVGNERDVGYLAEEVWNSGFDPDIIEYEQEHPDEEITEWECHTMFYGLKLTEDGLYKNDPKQPFSIIWTDWAGGTYSILKSPYVQFCTPCSPCCPGQVSLGEPGEYLGFSPSIEDLDEEEWKNYYETEPPEVWVWDLEYELKRMELMLENNQRFYKVALNTPDYPCDRLEEMKKRIVILISLVGALSIALAENQKNTEQRILVKQMRIE